MNFTSRQARLRRHRDAATQAAMIRRGELAAILGTVLLAVSLPLLALRDHWLEQGMTALRDVNLDKIENTTATVEAISRIAEKIQPASDISVPASVMFIAAALLLIYAFYGGRYRRRWFFWSTLILGVAQFVYPILGGAFGFWLLWCLLWTRQEFFALPILPQQLPR